MSSTEKTTKKERLTELVIKLGVKLSAFGFIGFILYFIIKAIICAFFGICII